MSSPSGRRGIGGRSLRWLTRGLQALLALAAVRGVTAGSIDLLANALAGLLATLVPDLLERRLDVAAPALSAWVAVAAALHVAGMVLGLYAPTAGYDDLTHAVSGSFVGAASVVVVRLWDRRVLTVAVPWSFGAPLALGVVVAGGVAWEIVEFAASGGGDTVQTSLADTLTDLLFGLVGGLLAVAVGWSRLDRTAERIAADLAERSDD